MKYKHGFINVLFGTPIRIWFVALLGIALGSTFVQAQPFAYVANFHSSNVSVIDTSNNTVTATVSVGSYPIAVAVIGPEGVDLSITNTGSPNPVKISRKLIYTLTVTNNGPSNATGVTLTDTPSSGVKFVSSTPSQGNCTGISTVTCALGTLKNKGTATVMIVVRPNKATGGTMLTNMASVKGNESDVNTTNNTATATTIIKKCKFVCCFF